MIRRPPRSTQSRSSAASDVYKRQAVTSRPHGNDRIRMALTHLRILSRWIEAQVMMTPVASSFPDIRSICAAGTSRLAGAHVLYGGAGPGRQAHDRPADRGQHRDDSVTAPALRLWMPRERARSQLRGSKVAVKWRRAGGSSTMR